EGAALERLRLGSLQAAGAQLVDAIDTGAVGRALDLDPTGSRVAVADLDENVRLYAVADGRLLWQAATSAHAGFRATGMPIARIRFSADGSRLVTATLEPPTFLVPHGRNNVLLDASDGRPIAPPDGLFPDLLDATYGSDGRYAVLRDRQGQAQLF